MHTLLIEDDAAVQTLVVEILRRNGSTADCVFDGVEAIRLLKTTPYDAVVLDLMLPEANGFEVLQEMYSCRPELMHRTIVITAASEKTLRNFDSRSVLALLRKPFELSEFETAIRACGEGDVYKTSTFTSGYPIILKIT